MPLSTEERAALQARYARHGLNFGGTESTIAGGGTPGPFTTIAPPIAPTSESVSFRQYPFEIGKGFLSGATGELADLALKQGFGVDYLDPATTGWGPYHLGYLAGSLYGLPAHLGVRAAGLAGRLLPKGAGLYQKAMLGGALGTAPLTAISAAGQGEDPIEAAISGGILGAGFGALGAGVEKMLPRVLGLRPGAYSRLEEAATPAPETGAVPPPPPVSDDAARVAGRMPPPRPVPGPEPPRATVGRTNVPPPSGPRRTYGEAVSEALNEPKPTEWTVGTAGQVADMEQVLRNEQVARDLFRGDPDVIAAAAATPPIQAPYNERLRTFLKQNIDDFVTKNPGQDWTEEIGFANQYTDEFLNAKFAQTPEPTATPTAQPKGRGRKGRRAAQAAPAAKAPPIIAPKSPGQVLFRDLIQGWTKEFDDEATRQSQAALAAYKGSPAVTPAGTAIDPTASPAAATAGTVTPPSAAAAAPTAAKAAASVIPEAAPLTPRPVATTAAQRPAAFLREADVLEDLAVLPKTPVTRAEIIQDIADEMGRVAPPIVSRTSRENIIPTDTETLLRQIRSEMGYGQSPIAARRATSGIIEPPIATPRPPIPVTPEGEAIYPLIRGLPTPYRRAYTESVVTPEPVVRVRPLSSRPTEIVARNQARIEDLAPQYVAAEALDPTGLPAWARRETREPRILPPITEALPEPQAELPGFEIPPPLAQTKGLAAQTAGTLSPAAGPAPATVKPLTKEDLAGLTHDEIVAELEKYKLQTPIRVIEETPPTTTLQTVKLEPMGKKTPEAKQVLAAIQNVERLFGGIPTKASALARMAKEKTPGLQDDLLSKRIEELEAIKEMEWFDRLPADFQKRVSKALGAWDDALEEFDPDAARLKAASDQIAAVLEKAKDKPLEDQVTDIAMSMKKKAGKGMTAIKEGIGDEEELGMGTGQWEGLTIMKEREGGMAGGKTPPEYLTLAYNQLVRLVGKEKADAITSLVDNPPSGARLKKSIAQIVTGESKAPGKKRGKTAAALLFAPPLINEAYNNLIEQDAEAV